MHAPPAPCNPAAPVILEWCAEHHDKDAPEELPPEDPTLDFIHRRPYATAFLVIHVLSLGVILFNGKAQAWVGSNMGPVVCWTGFAAFIWYAAGIERPLGTVVCYQIDLAAQQMVLHFPSYGSGIRIVRLSFSSIDSVRPFQTTSHSTTSGIDIGFFDDAYMLKKVRVADVLPENLVNAHMEALRPALGLRVEETYVHDN